MHKYRRQAKYAAWYPDESDADAPWYTRNPFGKYKSPDPSRKNTLRGQEEGLTQIQTNPEHVSTVRQADRSVKPARHAATTPAASSNTYTTASSSTAEPIPRSESPVDENFGEKSYEGISDDTITNGNASPYPNEKENSIRSRDSKHKHKHNLADIMHGTTTDRAEEAASSDGKDKKPKKKFTVMGQIRATLFNSWINVLLICVPVGIALHFAKVSPYAIFIVNFIAIIPLAAMLSYATEEIALRVGEVLGGLLNATFGNAVELIVSIIALVKDQVLIVQTSLIGSMLSNLLLVMGMSFFFGGINRMEQNFNMTVAQTAASLLFLAVSSLILPTVFDEFAQTGETVVDPAQPKTGVAELSRGTAIMLLFVYACYLFFQLKSHTKLFAEPSQKTEKRNAGEKFKKAVVPKRFRHAATPPPEEGDADEEEAEEPQLSILVAILTLAASTVCVALNAEFLVDSINDITCGGHISKTFVGLILLPIVGNAAEHATAVTVAVKDKMDLAIGVAVGSSMQIALLVLPLIVVLGWILGKDDMTLFFDGFQIATLFVSVLLVNYLIQDGKSHWLEGILLMILYLIIAVAAWFYPTNPAASDCPVESGSAAKFRF